MLKTVFNAIKGYRSLKKNPPESKLQMEKDTLNQFLNLAKEYGCKDVGFTKVPRKYLFKNKKILYENAIVVTYAMDKKKMTQVPDLISGKEIWNAYAQLGMIVNKLAKFLRKQAFQVEPGPALGGEVNYPLLAQKAGLGIIGKHGLLISEECGPSQRIAAIYTNIENLPFTDQNIEKYSWIPNFCEKCNKCVNACPANVIYKTTKILEDRSEEHIDYTKCAVPFANNAACSICIKECAFFKSDFNKIKKAFI